MLPRELHDIVQAVLGLDDRPQALRKRLRAPQPFIDSAVSGGYSLPDLARLYDFPEASGAGQCIAIIALGGGYDTANLQAYFSGVGIAMPQIVTPDADAEVTCDIEIVGSIAPQAKLVVYLAPDTDQGFLHALQAAVLDDIHRPAIVSVSLGQPECTWSQHLRDAFDQLLQAAAKAGITVCCASGDAGSSCGLADGKAHVEYPASSPWVLACGGTTLRSEGGAISGETVWNQMARKAGAGGGGISDLYDVPNWQVHANIPPSANSAARRGRGVPDVAANADSTTAYQLRVAGRNIVAGGTSAAAPLWAGLIARMNQLRGKPLGFLNPILYQARAMEALRPITSGDNGAYHAHAGWNACTGLGAPKGNALLAALTKST